MLTSTRIFHNEEKISLSFNDFKELYYNQTTTRQNQRNINISDTLTFLSAADCLTLPIYRYACPSELFQFPFSIAAENLAIKAAYAYVLFCCVIKSKLAKIHNFIISQIHPNDLFFFNSDSRKFWNVTTTLTYLLT